MNPYHLAPFNSLDNSNDLSTCSENFNQLRTYDDCDDAVPWIKTKYPGQGFPEVVMKQNSNKFPSGCYVYLRSVGQEKGIYFNSDSTNQPALYAHQVCIKGTLGNEFYTKGSFLTNILIRFP